MSNFSDNLKKVIKGQNVNDSYILKKPQMKTLSKVIGVAALGMFVIYLSTVFTKPATIDLGPTPSLPALSKAIVEKKDQPTKNNSQINQDEKVLEQKLEEALTQIEGVGDINVTLTLASTPELKYALNVITGKKNTKEKDQSGGSRTISELNENGQIVLKRGTSNENETPVIVKEINPEIKGVLVVAEGAKNPEIRRELTKAIQTLLGVDSNKVTVMPKGNR